MHDFYNLQLRTKNVFILANNTDPVETPLFAASHLGLRCLHIFPFSMTSACSTRAYFELRLATASANSVESGSKSFSRVMYQQVTKAATIGVRWLKGAKYIICKFSSSHV